MDLIAGALSWKSSGMGSLTLLTIMESHLDINVQGLANRYMRLIFLNLENFACDIARSSLIERTKAHQYKDRHLCYPRDKVQQGDATIMNINDGNISWL